MNFYPIEIKFRNASGKWGSLAEQAIKVVSPNRIHVEAKFPDGRSFSSTSAKEALDGKNGVRFKDNNYSHPERWSDYTLWVTKQELDEILFGCECLVAVGGEYDYRGAAGCAFTGSQQHRKWFCSEVVFDRICTKWLPARINHKMHPDALEEIIIALQLRLKLRKMIVEGVS